MGIGVGSRSGVGKVAERPRTKSPGAPVDLAPLTKPSPVPTHFFNPEVIQQIVRESRASQGLSPTITDPAVIARLAVLVKGR